MEEATASSLKGQFLVAMPKLVDPDFHKTVTCITEFSDRGALGITINRVYPKLSGKDIFDELKIDSVPRSETIPIHAGGPTHVSELFILHGPPFGWEGCYQITPYLGLSTTRDILQAIATDRGPEFCLVSLGCAGWLPGQLDSEMRENSWLTCDFAEDIMFKAPIDARWEMAVKTMGIDPMTLSDTAGHA